MGKPMNTLIKFVPVAFKQKIKELISRIVKAQLVEEQESMSQVLTLSKKVEDLEIMCEQVNSILQDERLIPPPPPKHLQIRVVGGYVPGFIRSGSTTYKTLNDVLKSIGKDFSDFHNILDFGCGCGRIIRAFKLHLPSHKLFGTDIDPEAIEWLKANYSSIAEFALNPHMPPMPYESNTFDFVYAISIFTHLPEEIQFAWLEDLRRVTKPGGYLILTTHGKKHYEKLAPEKVKVVHDKGFYYDHSPDITTDGLPDFYKVSYHSHDYIRKEWKRYFEVLKMIDRGLEDHQDIILLQKRI